MHRQGPLRPSSNWPKPGAASRFAASAPAAVVASSPSVVAPYADVVAAPAVTGVPQARERSSVRRPPAAVLPRREGSSDGRAVASFESGGARRIREPRGDVVTEREKYPAGVPCWGRPCSRTGAPPWTSTGRCSEGSSDVVAVMAPPPTWRRRCRRSGNVNVRLKDADAKVERARASGPGHRTGDGYAGYRSAVLADRRAPCSRFRSAHGRR